MHGAGGLPGLRHDGLHFKAGFFNDKVPQHQNLGQHPQHQRHGNDGATAQAFADGRDHGVGGHERDQLARAGQNGARGENGGKGGVQRIHNGLMGLFQFFQLGVMAGDHNGVVDVGAHLDGVHDQIAQEVQRAARDGRHRKVDPDASLDHHDQQHRQACRHKGEQQHQDHKKRTQHADQRVILHKAGGKVHSRGAVAHNVKILRVIVAHDLVHLFQHGLGFVALLGQIEIHHHAGIVIALQLQLGFVQLIKQIVQILLGVIVQRNVALVHFPLDEPEHIIQGHLVVIQPVQDLAILALVGGVGRIQQLCHLVVNVHQLGKLARRNGIRQGVAVLCFHIGKALGAAYAVVAVQLLQYGAFIVIMPPGHDHRHQIFVAEGILNLVMGNLAFALLGGGQIRVGVHIGALVGKHRGHHRHHHKQRRNDKAGFYIKLSDRRDLGDQVFVLGGIDPAAEQHQKPGHQRKH